MWQSIWKWIKRILFIATMLVNIACSIVMFGDLENGLSIFLTILSIILSIGSCVLYFIFNEIKKWPIVLILIVIMAIAIYLSISLEANIFPISIICAFIGIVISCGTKWVNKANDFLGGKK